MLTEQNKALVLKFYKAFDDRKMDRALELLASNFIAHMAGMPEPLDGEEFKQFGMVTVHFPPQTRKGTIKLHNRKGRRINSFSG